MKDGNRPDGEWNGNQYEWQGNRRTDAGAYRNSRTLQKKSGHPEPDSTARDTYEEYEWDDAQNEYEESESENPETEKKRSSVSLLTTIQIIGCCAVLAAAVVLKMTGSKIYADFRSWYVSAANDSIIAQEQMDQARRTVIGLWNTISSAGPRQPSVSETASSVSSSGAASSQAPASSAGSAAEQGGTAENNASGGAGKGAASSP